MSDSTQLVQASASPQEDPTGQMGVFAGVLQKTMANNSVEDLRELLNAMLPNNVVGKNLNRLHAIHLRVVICQSFAKLLVVFLTPLAETFSDTRYLQVMLERVQKDLKNHGEELFNNMTVDKANEAYKAMKASAGDDSGTNRKKGKSSLAVLNKDKDSDAYITEQMKVFDKWMRCFSLQLGIGKNVGKHKVPDQEWEKRKALQELIRTNDEDFFSQSHGIAWFKNEGFEEGISKGNPKQAPLTVEGALSDLKVIDELGGGDAQESLVNDMWTNLNNLLLLANANASLEDELIEEVLDKLKGLFEEFMTGDTLLMSELVEQAKETMNSMPQLKPLAAQFKALVMEAICFNSETLLTTCTGTDINKIQSNLSMLGIPSEKVSGVKEKIEQAIYAQLGERKKQVASNKTAKIELVK